MALPEIIEQPPPRPARVDANGLTAARQWSVLARTDFEAIRMLMEARGVRRGAVYTTLGNEVIDPNLTCQSLEANGKPAAVAGGVGNYIVTAEYANVTLAAQAPQPGKPAVWTVLPSLTSSPVDVDAYGGSIFTSSMEPVEPPITALLPEEILHGEFYVRAADALEAYKPFRPFNATINDDFLPRLGAARGCLLCHVFRPEPSETGWIKMTVDFQYRPPKTRETAKGTRTYPGWADVFPDMGRRRLRQTGTATDVGNMWEPIPDSKGNRILTPVPLDGAGNTVADYERAAQNLLNYKPVMIEKYNYRFARFSAIPFPPGSI